MSARFFGSAVSSKPANEFVRHDVAPTRVSVTVSTNSGQCPVEGVIHVEDYR